MATITIIDPVTRIEGHMKAEVTIEGGTVIDAKISGTLFRGFENIMTGRAPDDAPLITQRICGVCPVPHAQASVLALEAIPAWKPAENARLLRNFILGANFLQSHILHFYLLSLVDYVPGPAVAPWNSYWDVDLRPGLEDTMAHLGDALAARRKADEMAAVFGGKIPHAASYVAGGMTPEITTEKINLCKKYVEETAAFIERVYIPDVQAVAKVYEDYFHIGAGCGNLLAFGAFENADGSRLLAPGMLGKGKTKPSALDPGLIQEHTSRSWYAHGAPVNPSQADTLAKHPKTAAYSWSKAPRYNGQPCEASALARMKISGNYQGGISCMDRFAARAQEAALVARAMRGWLDQLSPGMAYDPKYRHAAGSGAGLTEAPRGALGHWAQIGADGRIARYQVITPSCWNASPQDDGGVKGPVEQALMGIKVRDEKRPIEVLRVIHSFDPCLACAVHALRPDGKPLVITRTRA